MTLILILFSYLKNDGSISRWFAVSSSLKPKSRLFEASFFLFHSNNGTKFYCLKWRHHRKDKSIFVPTAEAFLSVNLLYMPNPIHVRLKSVLRLFQSLFSRMVKHFGMKYWLSSILWFLLICFGAGLVSPELLREGRGGLYKKQQ